LSANPVKIPEYVQDEVLTRIPKLFEIEQELDATYCAWALKAPGGAARSAFAP